ncbi:TPA: hypothetical protein ACSW2U_005512 [Enterobacter roggenkampii]|uniref:hypothetical protein n=1 Tax=Enterobacter roggenkampii TaxID=1812935 RepID=UPI0007B34D56|nr:hypothetical protein [Enterobacter roggenkampii]HED6271762.1 hypothetical protein [Enterobacter sichuanensis]KZP72466.1 hypothetical protein A3460_18345 [Enterobacter roggenkampii]HED6273560.1 hypothetical protein [Enterobacter sichuanensis]HEM8743758.1 hypothetical protein [Enterobacter sichuanensis]HEM8746893.1 hypothetical protein [Enterobacter sichuanensis]
MTHIDTKNNWVQDKSANVGSTYNKVVLNYFNKYYFSEDDNKNTSTNLSTYVEYADSSALESKAKNADDLEKIMSFVYKMLLTEDFGYGDNPQLKYVVENIFRKSKSEAQMSFINMATRKVYVSDSVTIEKFFALLMSLDESDIEDIVLTIIQMFLSHKDISAAEGALSLLDKYGKDRDALEIAKQIRKFDYGFLNEYKEKVISNLKQHIKE